MQIQKWKVGDLASVWIRATSPGDGYYTLGRILSFGPGDLVTVDLAPAERQRKFIYRTTVPMGQLTLKHVDFLSAGSAFSSHTKEEKSMWKRLSLSMDNSYKFLRRITHAAQGEAVQARRENREAPHA